MIYVHGFHHSIIYNIKRLKTTKGPSIGDRYIPQQNTIQLLKKKKDDIHVYVCIRKVIQNISLNKKYMMHNSEKSGK